MLKKLPKNIILEWFGVITAILYSMLIALNIGAEFLGFTLLLIISPHVLWLLENEFVTISYALNRSGVEAVSFIEYFANFNPTNPIFCTFTN